MKTISLIIMPGTGRSVHNIYGSTTLGDFAAAHNVTDRQLCLNGEEVPSSRWGDVDLFTFDGRVEIAALQGSKGN